MTIGMTGSRENGRREIIGVFLTLEQIRAAAGDLVELGFAREALGLLSPAEPFGASAESAPEGEWVRRESVGDVGHAGAGALSLAGTTALGAAVVASAGALGGAVIAATAGAATMGAVGAAMSRVIHKNDAEYLEEQLDKGRLLLFVRIAAGNASRPKDIMSQHGAIDVREVTVVPPES